MITLDASVWIAFFEQDDAFNAASDALLTQIRDSAMDFHSPEFALMETGCALARRRRDPAIGRTVARIIASIPNLDLIPLSRIGADAVLAEGCGRFLRGADAIYAATARITRSQLITWDNELIARAAGVTPADWLAQRT